jgi:hypothetical protein
MLPSPRPPGSNTGAFARPELVAKMKGLFAANGYANGLDTVFD